MDLIEYRIADPQPRLDLWGPRTNSGKGGRCFSRATEAAERYHLRYCEGWAYTTLPSLYVWWQMVMPHHHAWVLDENDRVIEATWRRPGHTYRGVVLKPTGEIGLELGDLLFD